MTMLEQLTKELADAIRNSDEYAEYHRLRKKIKAEEELYEKLNNYRKRNLMIQLSQEDNYLMENERLQNEFEDVISNDLAREFLLADVKLCRMLREISDGIMEAAEVDVDFLG